MSSVDNRIVKMTFDNAQFENGVSQTLGTLGKLKSSLDFDKEASGMDGLSEATNSVSSRFSALEIIAITALQNITNSVVNLGKRMLSDLTIAPISDGFSEYELKMGSVQTIMNSSGESLQAVNGYLNELNEYADRTIYSFSDMTNSIGKFTNAGVSLDKAVLAIKGVSNEAAVSGANANEASRAMYNFAQAISAGSVKLIDWKSIENANMATVEFKQELLKTAEALGTVKKEGDKYVSTTSDLQGKVSDAFDATTGFNDSLSHQWMTTDVLVETLSKYADETTEIGKKAYKAATEVKTFSQMIDTLKEAVGTGWADSFEIIFGDFEEAKTLWTGVNNAISSIIDAQSKARNEILSSWKQLGGRAAILQSVVVLWNSLSKIAGAIGEAFKEIIPPLTGSSLAELSKRILVLTTKLKVSDETAEKVKRTFSGFFAVVKLGLTILKTAVGLVGSFVKAIFPLSGSLLDTAANLGDFVKSLAEGIEQSRIFQETAKLIQAGIELLGKAVKACSKFISEMFPSDLFNGVSNGVGAILGVIGNGVGALANAFSKLAGCETVIKVLNGLFSTITNIGTQFGNVIRFAADGIQSFFSKGADSGGLKVLQGLMNLLRPFTTLCAELAQVLVNGISRVDFADIMASISGVFMLMSSSNIKKVLDGVTDFVNGFSDNFIAPLKGALKPFSSLLNDLGDTLKAFQEGIKASNLLKIAGAVGILAVSLSLLSQIDPLRLALSVAAIYALFDMLARMGNTLGKFQKDQAKTISKLAVSLIAVSAAVLVLAAAVRVLGGMDLQSLTYGLIGLGAVFLELATFVDKINDKKDLKSATKGIISLGIAINLIAVAVKSLGKLDVGSLVKGLVSVGVILMELSLFLSTSEISNVGIKTAASMILIGVALNVLGSAVKKIGSIKFESLLKGLIATNILLRQIDGFAESLGSNTKGLLSTSAAMVVIGAALKLFASAVEKLGSLSLWSLIKGLSALQIVLLEMTGALDRFSGAGVLKNAAAMIVMSGAVAVLTASMTKLAGLSLGGICKSLIAVGGAMYTLVVACTALSAMPALGPSIAAILAFSAAVALLAPGMILLGSISFGQIIKSIVAIGSAFAVLGTAAAFLAPLTPAILALSGALALIGVGVFALGAGVVSLSTGLAALSVSGLASFKVLIEGVKMVLAAFPQMLITILQGIVGFVAALGSVAGTLFQAVGQIISGILMMLKALVPDVCLLFLELLKGICKVIVDGVPDVVVAAIQLVIGLCTGIAQEMPRLVQAAFDLIIAFVDGLAVAITGNYGRIYAACGNLLVAIATCFFQLIPNLMKIGGDLIMAMIDGMFDAIGNCWGVLKNVFNSFVDGIKSFFHIGDAGKEQGEELANNLASGKDSVAQAASDVGTTASQSLKDSLSDTAQIGQDCADGIVEGMSSAKDSVGEIGTETGQSFTDSFQNAIANVDTSASMSSIVASVSSYSDSFSAAGASSMSSYASGMNSSGAIEVPGAVTGVLGQGVSVMVDHEGTFEKQGLNSMIAFSKGESSGADPVKAQASSAAAKGANAADSKRGQYHTAGYNAMAGMAQGIRDGQQLAIDAAAVAAANALAAAKKELKTHSPSKRFEDEVGLMAVKGFALGISKNTDIAEDAASEMGNNSLNSIKLIMNRVRDLFNEEFNLNPVITPVLDSTKIQNGSAMLSSLFDNQLVDVGLFSDGRKSFAQSAALGLHQMKAANRQREISKADIYSGNERIVEELTNLRSDVNALNHSMLNMKLYLNKKALVGGIVNDVDSALGDVAHRKLRNA